ncbi:nucleotide pyrophosphohydrolase [Amycolatopsis sp. NPDC051716]|uniref:nucleotide pyrophosphohydrolase n=1 Tax=Amycolatopsis sp. NPDC051716 TaxID=3155804 RepID=UPI00341E9CB8
MDLDQLTRRLREFASERDWDQFHTPKNLAMALVGEAGELTEIFQWLTPEDSARIMEDPATAQEVQNEIADVFAYLLRLADVLGIDIAAALTGKIALNEVKYPAALARGTAVKYDKLRTEH